MSGKANHPFLALIAFMARLRGIRIAGFKEGPPSKREGSEFLLVWSSWPRAAIGGWISYCYGWEAGDRTFIEEDPDYYAEIEDLKGDAK